MHSRISRGQSDLTFANHSNHEHRTVPPRNSIQRVLQDHLKGRIERLETVLENNGVTVRGRVRTHRDRLRAVATVYYLAALLRFPIHLEIEVRPEAACNSHLGAAVSPDDAARTHPTSSS